MKKTLCLVFICMTLSIYADERGNWELKKTNHRIDLYVKSIEINNESSYVMGVSFHDTLLSSVRVGLHHELKEDEPIIFIWNKIFRERIEILSPNEKYYIEFPEPLKIITKMKKKNTLTIKAVTIEGEVITAKFDISEFRELIKPYSSITGW